MQLHAVTWNSGVGAIITTCAGVAAAGGVALISPAAMAFASAADNAVVMYARLKMLWIEPRWVSWAPFGNPVVPDV